MDVEPPSMSMCANSRDYYKQRSDWAMNKIAELEAQLKTASERLDIILSKCFIRSGAAIALPCGYGKITDDDKQESIRQLDKAIHNTKGE